MCKEWTWPNMPYQQWQHVHNQCQCTMYIKWSSIVKITVIVLPVYGLLIFGSSANITQACSLLSVICHFHLFVCNLTQLALCKQSKRCHTEWPRKESADKCQAIFSKILRCLCLRFHNEIKYVGLLYKSILEHILCKVSL